MPTPVKASDVFSIAIIGDSASSFRDGVAVRDLWPAQFVRQAMPQTATLFNLSGRFNTADRATRRSVPLLSAVKPKVVVIWLGFDDVFENVDPKQFADNVLQVVRSSQAAGATTVLVGTLPGELPGADSYNQQLRLSIGSAAIIVETSTIPMKLVRIDDRIVPATDSLQLAAAAVASAYAAE